MRRRIAPAILLAVSAVALVLAVAMPSGGAAPGPNRAVAAGWAELLRDGRAGATLPIEVVLLFDAPSVAEVAAGGGAPEAARRQQAALDSLASRGLRIDVRRRYLNALNAVVTTIPPTIADDLRRSPEVAAVYPVRRIYPATIVESALAVLGDAARPLVPAVEQDGTDVTVALLDGPVDAAHPYLGGRIGPAWNAITQLPASPAPTPLAARHGTAMAGIVAGSGGPAGLRGVAPGATVLPVQVLELQSGELEGTTATLLSGLERALDPNGDGDLRDRARVIVAPLAAPFAAFADSAESVALDGAQRAGSLVVAAAGNDGATLGRYGTIASPAAAPSALAVGALDGRPLLPAVTVRIRGDALERDVEAVPVVGALAPAVDVALSLVHLAGPTQASPKRPGGESASGAVAGDYLSPEDGSSLVDGRAVLVARDGGSLEARAVAAAQAGARALLLYGEGPLASASLGLDDRAPIPVLGLPAAAGAEIAAALASGSQIEVEFSETSAPANPDQGAVASFSSRGLAFAAGVKPDLVAPGVAITSALPGGGYAAVTGTSAAAAQAAGAAALLAQAHPDWDAAALRAALIGSSAVVLTAGLTGTESIEAQGAGRIDPPAALAATVLAEPATLSFGAAADAVYRESRTLSLRNLGTEPATVSLALVRDDAAEAANLSLAADRPSIEIPAGETRPVTFALEASGLGGPGTVVGGWIVAESATGARTRVPFAIAVGGDPTVSLLPAARIEPSTFKAFPDGGLPARLELSVGSVGAAGDDERVDIAPVARLSIDLYRGSTKLGRLVEVRSLLPGVYRYGLTGRGLDGQALGPGAYRLVIAAESLEGITSERDLPFTISD